MTIEQDRDTVVSVAMAPEPDCDLCHDTGRVGDDIPCWKCDRGWYHDISPDAGYFEPV